MAREPARGEGKPAAPGVATAMRSSSTIVGLHFAGVAAAGAGFAGSVPIAGKVQLEGLLFFGGVTAAIGSLHQAQLGVASDVPANQADVDAGEQLFSRASTASGDRSTIFWASYYGGMWFPLTTVVAMNGRRFIGRVTNAHASTAGEFYVGLLIHRVFGGGGLGDPVFLGGEEIEDR